MLNFRETIQEKIKSLQAITKPEQIHKDQLIALEALLLQKVYNGGTCVRALGDQDKGLLYTAVRKDDYMLEKLTKSMEPNAELRGLELWATKKIKGGDIVRVKF